MQDQPATVNQPQAAPVHAGPEFSIAPGFDEGPDLTELGNALHALVEKGVDHATKKRLAELQDKLAH